MIAATGAASAGGLAIAGGVATVACVQQVGLAQRWKDLARFSPATLGFLRWTGYGFALVAVGLFVAAGVAAVS